MSGPDKSKLKEKVRHLPHKPGVYLMKDRLDRVIYVGKAKDLKNRVSTYFHASRKKQQQQPKVRAMLDLIYDFEVHEVKSEPEALLLEGRLIKQYRPKYNTDFTDDKRFLLVRVDMREALPRFRLVRFKKDDDAVYFGPFAHSGLLRRTLHEMRRRFGILQNDAQPEQLEDGNWQLYADIRREIYGNHPNVVTGEDYRERVEQACVFLQGKSKEWLEEVREQMMDEAKRQNYEKAAELRDIVKALEKTTQRTRKFTRDPGVLKVEPQEALEQLREALRMEELPERMECFDISHISGSYCVASMVHFAAGVANKNNYRRFKIKTFTGNDDFRAMEEVVGRRYKRLYDEGRRFPALVVIDGGAGQVSAALKAFLSHGLEPPELIGLAKKRETIIFSDGRPPLNLPYHHEGLKLLMRLRDEAHRFANSFNADLRSQRIRETVLDDFGGLGPVRREALLKHFKTIERLKRATIDDLREVEGIGPKLAGSLQAFLAER